MKLLSRTDASDLKEESYRLKDGRILRIKSFFCDDEIVLEVYLDSLETGVMEVGEEW